MNLKAVAVLVAGMLLILSAFQALSGAVAYVHGEMRICQALLVSAICGVGVSAPIYVAFRGAVQGAGRRADVYRREGLAAVGIGWTASVLLGALPFLFSGFMRSPIDAIFESAAGFTTTGASVLTGERIAALPKGLALWRSTTHWLGGVGIVVVLVSVLPAGGRSLFRSEVPGLQREAMLQRVKDSAWAMLRIYLGLTVIEFAALWALGMSPFDAVIHTFGTVATGGFSNRPESVGYYESFPIELVIVVFMLMAGTNFTLYDHALRYGAREGLAGFWRNSEWRLYMGLIVVGTLFVGMVLWFQPAPIAGKDYSSLLQSMRDALFQVSAVCTTTGYSTADFDQWPWICKLVLLGLFMTGASAGSTAGGIKLARVFVLFKVAIAGVVAFVRPRAVHVVRMNGEPLEDEVVLGVGRFFMLWCLALVVGTFLIVCSGTTLLEGVACAMTSLGNIGPALGRYGPAESFHELADFGKLVMALWMIVGRLEFYALLALVLPSFWRS